MRSTCTRVFSLLACTLLGAVTVQAEPLKIRFSTDWVVNASTAWFYLARDRGFYKDENLEVEIDSGRGGAEFVQKLLGGKFDMAVGDITAYIQYVSNNPTDQTMKAYYIIGNRAPYTILSLKKTGITKPSDLVGKKIASAAFAAARSAWPAFARANSLPADAMGWQIVDPAVRMAMLMQGTVQTVAGFTTDVPALENLGIGRDQVSLLNYADYGVLFYSNAVFVRTDFAKAHPQAAAGMARAISRAIKLGMEDPSAAIASIKKANPLIDERLEAKVLNELRDVIITDETRKAGLGAADERRLSKQIEDVAFAAKLTVTPAPAQIYTDAYLPPLADRLP